MNAPAPPSDFSPRDGLRGALYMANRGVRSFRIVRGTKNHFLDKAWTATATALAFDIADDWRGQEFNVGLLMNGFVAIDVDVKDGKPGLASLAEIERHLPRTYRQRTPSGGFHLIYRNPPGIQFANSQCQLASGIDIRGFNGYVLGAGSEVDGGLYEVVDPAPIAEVPMWLIEKLSVAHRKDPTAPKFVGAIDTPASIDCVVSYLKSSAEPAIENAGGNATTYAVANACMDRGVWPDTAVDLMLEHYNPRCVPEWDDDDLRAIVKNATQYRQNPIGCYSPAAGFETIASVAPCTDDLEALLERASDITRGDILAASALDILKGMIAPAMGATIYGETGVGKSHIALDLAYHIAHGLAYHGLKTRQVPVLYVQLEGVAGFKKRILASTEKFGDPGDYFRRLKVHVSLAKDANGQQGADTIIRVMRHLQQLTGSDSGLVIIDTKARATAGDNENDGADMSNFTEKRQGYIARATNTCVLAVHHPNKGGDYRGHSSQKAGDDLVLKVERGKVTSEKVKDGVEGPFFNFALEQVHLGTDTDGAAVTTCVVQKAPAAPVAPATSKPEHAHKEPKEAATLRVAFLKVAREIEHPETGELVEGATTEAVRDEFFASYPAGEANSEKAQAAKRTAWWRALRRKLPPDFKVRTFGGVELMWMEQVQW